MRNTQRRLNGGSLVEMGTSIGESELTTCLSFARKVADARAVEGDRIVESFCGKALGAASIGQLSPLQNSSIASALQ